MKKQRRRKLYYPPNPEWVVIFNNKRGTKIILSCSKCRRILPYKEGISYFVEARWRGKHGNNDSMPITHESLYLSFSDYSNIITNVLGKDKVARRWFRKTVKDTVIDDRGTRLGDFFISGDIVDHVKIQEYSDSAWEIFLKEYNESECKKSNNT